MSAYSRGLADDSPALGAKDLSVEIETSRLVKLGAIGLLGAHLLLKNRSKGKK